MREEGDANRYCTNPVCPAKLYESLRYFVSRGALDIRGVGEKLTRQLLDAGLVKDAADFYSLTAEQLANLERGGEKKAANVLAQLKESKQKPLWRLVNALGMAGVGERNARALARAFGSLDALLAATPEQIEAVPGLGGVLAESVRVENSPVRSCSSSSPNSKPPGWGAVAAEQETRSSELSGLNFVLTGALSRPREVLKAALEARGSAGDGQRDGQNQLPGGGRGRRKQTRACPGA